MVLPRGRGQYGNTPSSNHTTPPTCGGHVLTGADGPRNALGMVATPPGNPWGVAVTVGVWWCPWVPVQHVAGAWAWPGVPALSRMLVQLARRMPLGDVHLTLGSRQVWTSGLWGALGNTQAQLPDCAHEQLGGIVLY